MKQKYKDVEYEELLNFVFMADVHFRPTYPTDKEKADGSEKKKEEYNMAAKGCYNKILSYHNTEMGYPNSKGVAFIAVGGDITRQSEKEGWVEFAETMLANDNIIPVFEGMGNHDMDSQGGKYLIISKFIDRNKIRGNNWPDTSTRGFKLNSYKHDQYGWMKKGGNIKDKDEGWNYMWSCSLGEGADAKHVHFFMLNLFPAYEDKVDIKGTTKYREYSKALKFLEDNLPNISPDDPIFLFHHYGMLQESPGDIPDYITKEQIELYYEVIRRHNIKLICYGHAHASDLGTVAETMGKKMYYPEEVRSIIDNSIMNNYGDLNLLLQGKGLASYFAHITIAKGPQNDGLWVLISPCVGTITYDDSYKCKKITSQKHCQYTDEGKIERSKDLVVDPIAIPFDRPVALQKENYELAKKIIEAANSKQYTDAANMSDRLLGKYPDPVSNSDFTAIKNYIFDMILPDCFMGFATMCKVQGKKFLYHMPEAVFNILTNECVIVNKRFSDRQLSLGESGKSQVSTASYLNDKLEKWRFHWDSNFAFRIESVSRIGDSKNSIIEDGGLDKDNDSKVFLGRGGISGSINFWRIEVYQRGTSFMFRNTKTNHILKVDVKGTGVFAATTQEYQSEKYRQRWYVYKA